MSSLSHRLEATCFLNATPQLVTRMGATLCVFFIALGGLGGCASSATDHIVDIRGRAPVPIVDPMPLTVAVYYPPEIQDFTSTQESLNGDSWQISFGDLQRNDIQRMLTSMFEQVIESPSASVPYDIDYDVLIIPRITDLSFLTPAESGTNFFAVSMRHFVSFFGPDGTDFGEWEINSYGRSRSFFGRRVKDMAREAGSEVMRDFATTIVLGLSEELVSRDIISADQVTVTGIRK